MRLRPPRHRNKRVGTDSCSFTVGNGVTGTSYVPLPPKRISEKKIRLEILQTRRRLNRKMCRTCWIQILCGNGLVVLFWLSSNAIVKQGLMWTRASRSGETSGTLNDSNFFNFKIGILSKMPLYCCELSKIPLVKFEIIKNAPVLLRIIKNAPGQI